MVLERLVVQTLRMRHLPHVAVRRRHVRMLAPKHLQPDVQTLLMVLERLVVQTLRMRHLPHVAVRRRHVRMLAPKHLQPDVQTLLIVLERLVVKTLRIKHCPHVAVRPRHVCSRGALELARQKLEGCLLHLECGSIQASCFLKKLATSPAHSRQHLHGLIAPLFLLRAPSKISVRHQHAHELFNVRAIGPSHRKCLSVS